MKTLLLTYSKNVKKKRDLSGYNKCKKLSVVTTEHRYFEIFILICILCNTIVLACHYFMIPETTSLIFESINSFFISVFILEAVMKLIAQKLDYFKDTWNRFDFLVLFLTLALLVPISMGYGSSFQGLISVLRILRVSRIIKIVVRAEKMMIIYKTLADTAPVLGSFGLLLLMLLFMFTVIAVQLFALVDVNAIKGLDRTLDYHVNFRDFPSAFLTLFRCATGESWNSIMYETGWNQSILFQCDYDETFQSIVDSGRDPNDWRGPQGCGNRLSSFIFFTIF